MGIRVSRFGAEIDSGGAQDTIEWEISLYVRRPAALLPLICPITSDQSFDLSARAKCCEDKKEMAGNMGVDGCNYWLPTRLLLR